MSSTTSPAGSAPPTPSPTTPVTTGASQTNEELQKILAFLRKNNLQDVEKVLQEEISRKALTSSGNGGTSSDVSRVNTKDGSSVLASYNSEGDPAVYEDVYQDLLRFVESSLDLYRHELALILYPVFVHMYLELVYNSHEKEAKAFVAKYGPRQESFYESDIKKLSFITKKQHMIGSELMENFKTSQFTVRMSRDTYSQLRTLKKFMTEKRYSVLWNIIQEHLYLDVYEGIARNKVQINATSGGMVGEGNRQANRSKVYFGLLKDPDLSAFLQMDEEVEADGEGKPKKKKAKREQLSLKKQKNDPHAPPSNRMPFPELRDIDKAEKARALKDMARRQILGPSSLPSVCSYTVINTGTSLSAFEVSDDSSLLAVGFTNAHIRVCSLSSTKLKALKPASDLNDLDTDADDILHRMNDESTAETAKTLLGHVGPIYGLSFSPDRQLLLSCSEDGTVRLWSLQTWTCLVVYKGHVLPVWQVKFCPQGYYFASCSHDKTVRLWNTEQSSCLRLFTGHFSDVDCLTFHPNCNYVASGSSDRSIRLWDCVTGQCVRLMTGHKDVVTTVAFSSDGRFLASGDSNSRVLIWNIEHGHLLADFSRQTGMISHLSFSRESNVLVSASNDFSLVLWDFAQFTSELNLEEANVTHNPSVNSNSNKYHLATFRTKDAPVFGTHFTRRNLLLAIAAYI